MFSFSPENTRVSTYINTNLSRLKCAVRLAHCDSLIHFLIGPSLILMKKVNTNKIIQNNVKYSSSKKKYFIQCSRILKVYVTYFW